jgi:peptide deformylase
MRAKKTTVLLVTSKLSTENHVLRTTKRVEHRYFREEGKLVKLKAADHLAIVIIHLSTKMLLDQAAMHIKVIDLYRLEVQAITF